MQTKPGNRIYHFCSLTKGLEYIFPQKRLLLSPIKNTNDPRENKSFVFAARHLQGDIIDNDNLNELNTEISDILRSDCKAICFCQDKNIFFGYELARMWAYYGDNHKGFCIELDKDEFLRENDHIIDRNLFNPIEYYELDLNKEIERKTIDHVTMNSIGKEKYLKDIFRKEHLNFLFFKKNKEWESENEIRLLHFSEKKENEYCSIEKSIRNIFLGVDFNENYLPSLIKSCPNVDISKLEYGEVRLIPQRINKNN